MIGYKEYNAEIKKYKGKAVLVVDEYGIVHPLQYTKEGFSIVRASDREKRILKEAGYPVRLM